MLADRKMPAITGDLYREEKKKTNHSYVNKRYISNADLLVVAIGQSSRMNVFFFYKNRAIFTRIDFLAQNTDIQNFSSILEQKRRSDSNFTRLHSTLFYMDVA